MRVADIMETLGEIHKNYKGWGPDQGTGDPPGDGDALHHNSVDVNILVVGIVVQLFETLALKETG